MRRAILSLAILLLELCGLRAQILAPILFGNANRGCAICAFTEVQSAANYNFSTSATVTFGSNNTAGNLLLAFIWDNVDLAVSSTVSDPSNGTWTIATASIQGAVAIFYVCNAVGGVAPTVTVAGPGNWHAIHIAEFSGTRTLSCLDQAGGNSLSSSSPSVAVASPITQGDMIVGGFGNRGDSVTYTIPAGETAIQTVNGSFAINSQTAYNNAVAFTGLPSLSATQSPSAFTVMSIAAFKLL